jgi:uncharacterized membrane protein YfcA
MPLLFQVNPLYSASGLFVGFLVGLTGVGGGSLMTPILVLIFGVEAHTAVGTDLLYASMTKTVGSAVHGTRGTVEWRIVAKLAAGSVPAATGTLLALAALNKPIGAVNHTITTILGVALILTAIALFFRGRLLDYFGRRIRLDARRTTIFTVLLGVALGVLVTLSSVGAGAIGLTVLLILYPSLPAGRLVGSDIAHAVPLTLIAGFGHWLIGDVNVRLLVSLLCGSIPGVIAGSLISSRVPDRMLRPVLASTLAFLGGKLMF